MLAEAELDRVPAIFKDNRQRPARLTVGLDGPPAAICGGQQQLKQKPVNEAVATLPAIKELFEALQAATNRRRRQAIRIELRNILGYLPSNI